MKISIKSKTNVHSNMFLRALWAEFRKNFGKCAWIYMPGRRKGEKYIEFGKMDISEAVVDVGIYYKRKGIIETIQFAGVKENSVRAIQFQKVINTVLHSLETIPQYKFNIKVASFALVSEYHSSNISIIPLSGIESLLQVTIRGYDEIDAKYQLLCNIDRILAVLSVETNCPFWISKSRNKIEMHGKCKENVFTEDLDWIDGYSLNNDFLTISCKGLELINQIANMYLEEDSTTRRIMNFCHQFHLARKQDASVWDTRQIKKINNACDLSIGMDFSMGMEGGYQEIATSLYMSSLEIAAEPVDNECCEKCAECKQLVYSIFARVKNLAEKYGGSDLVKSYISPYYNKRSEFLHQGDLLIKRYVGHSLPMLDEKGEAAVIDNIALLNLREYVGFLLRKTLQDLLAAK